MDRLFKLLGVKKPEVKPDSEFPPLPKDDDINAKGLTQYFNLNLIKGGSATSAPNDDSGNIMT